MRNAIIATGTILSMSILLLTGCGQMGPLYLPDAAEPAQTETESSAGTGHSETS